MVFDRLAELVCDSLTVPVAMVSLIDDTRQFFKSCIGLPEPLNSRRETELTHSICQYVVGDDSPLIIEDAREDPRAGTSLVVTHLGVVAYAGMPLHADDGHPIGTLCAIDVRPRAWTPPEIATLRRLADVAEQVITLRQSALATEAEHARRFRRESQQLAIEAEASQRLQRGLLPREVAGPLAERVTSVYRAGSERILIGGDFADVWLHRDGAVSFVVGDVCGHSPEAAALAVALRGSWSAMQPDRLPLERIAARLNSITYRERRDTSLFVTAVIGQIDPSGRFDGLCAGHPRPLKMNSNGVEEVELPHGLPFGIERTERWTSASTNVEGCEMLAFTDGLIEGRRTPDSDKRYGVDELMLAIDRIRAAGDERAQLSTRLLDSAMIAHGGPLPDDVAILHIRPPS